MVLIVEKGRFMEKVTSIRLEESDLSALREIEKVIGAKPAAQIRLAISQYIERWHTEHSSKQVKMKKK
jgi:hypothetical protein